MAGMMIYNLEGKSSEQGFARSWAVGYALDNAQQWQEVAQAAAQAAVVLMILDRLCLISPLKWRAPARRRMRGPPQASAEGPQMNE